MAHLLLNIVENCRNAIAILDRDMNFIYANRRYRKELRVSEVNVRGKSPRQVCQSYPANWPDAARRALAGEYVSMVDDHCIQADGSLAWINWDCRSWYLPDGKAGGIVFYADFAVDRHHPDPLLQASESRLQSVFNQIPQGVALIDAVNGQVYLANPRFTAILGQCGQTCLPGAGHSTLLPQHKTLLSQLRSGRISSLNKERRYTQPNGSIVWIQINITMYIGADCPNPAYLWMIDDISEQRRREDDLLYRNRHDVLTGLYNRAFLDEEKLLLDIPSQLPLSVIVGDINGLKMINDTFGRDEGDHLLSETARILQNCCRPDDFLVRTGGDEFCILMPRTSSAAAAEVLANIDAACKSYENNSAHGPCFLSLSLGDGTRESLAEPLESTIRLAEDHMLRRKILEQCSLHSSILSSIKATMHEKSHETKEHSERMAVLARRTGQVLGLQDSQLQDLELLSNVHDIGKIVINDQILNKPDQLTDQEWLEMKKHPSIGYRIAQASPDIRHIADSILCHHERWDGLGYPQGLAGDAIPICSRILSVVDAYDAMTHDRPYRKAMSVEAALKEIRKNAGQQFDPEIAIRFAQLVARVTI